MINLRLLNRGLNGVLTPQEFMLLYVISNAIKKNNSPTKLYDEMLADKVGLSTRQIRRWKDGLEEKGFIKRCVKQVSKEKKECYYSLNLDALFVNKSDEIDDKECKKVEEFWTPVSYYKNKPNELNKSNPANSTNEQNNKTVEEEFTVEHYESLDNDDLPF